MSVRRAVGRCTLTEIRIVSELVRNWSTLEALNRRVKGDEENEEEREERAMEPRNVMPGSVPQCDWLLVRVCVCVCVCVCVQILDAVVVQASPAVVCSPFVLNCALLQRPYRTLIA